MRWKDKIKKAAGSIGGKVVMVLGTVGIITLGWTGIQWPNEIKGNEVNYHVINEDLGTIAYVGDPGLLSPQREAIFKDLKLQCEVAQAQGVLFTTVYPGDLQYPKGTTDDDGHDKYIKPTINLCPAHKYSFKTLGNHGLLAFVGQGYMSKRYHGKAIAPGSNMPNYYYVIEDQKRVLLFNESTMFDSIIPAGIEGRQVAFDAYAVKRAGAKPITFVAHHPFFTPEKRTPAGRYIDLWKAIGKYLQQVIAGHAHMIWKTQIGGVWHYITGMGSKTTKPPVGYAIQYAGRPDVEFRVLGTAPVTPSGEQDE